MKRDERKIERLIPNDAAEYLEPRPNEGRYAHPLVLKDGTEIDLNEPGPFASPAPAPSLVDRLFAAMRAASRRGSPSR
jgi:hypothetical protein